MKKLDPETFTDQLSAPINNVAFHFQVTSGFSNFLGWQRGPQGLFVWTLTRVAVVRVNPVVHLSDTPHRWKCSLWRTPDTIDFCALLHGLSVLCVHHCESTSGQHTPRPTMTLDLVATSDRVLTPFGYCTPVFHFHFWASTEMKKPDTAFWGRRLLGGFHVSQPFMSKCSLLSSEAKTLEGSYTPPLSERKMQWGIGATEALSSKETKLSQTRTLHMSNVVEIFNGGRATQQFTSLFWTKAKRLQQSTKLQKTWAHSTHTHTNTES